MSGGGGRIVEQNQTVVAAEIPGLDAALARDIYEHCFSTMDREVGGVLVGTMKRGSAPQVNASIRAQQADETAAQLRFTQDTWEHIHRELQAKHPGEQIVGWYHSHPGYGLFLSEQDLFIHHNFFQNRSQIALVLDPVAGEEAVFAWRPTGVEEYFRRKSSYEELFVPLRGRRAAAPRNLNLVQAARREPAGTSSSEASPVTTAIYLFVIALSMGIIFWELFLR